MTSFLDRIFGAGQPSLSYDLRRLRAVAKGLGETEASLPLKGLSRSDQVKQINQQLGQRLFTCSAKERAGVANAAEVNAGIPDARDIHIQPDWLVDLAFNAKLLNDKLGFTVGVDNLFDQYPDRVPIARALPTPPGGVVNLDATNATAFSRYSPYGFNGRFLYARMAFNW